MMHVENLFPTPIYQCDINDFESVQEEIASNWDKINFVPAPSDWGKTHKLSSANFNDDVISELGLEKIRDQIMFNVVHYCDALGFNIRMKDFAMSSWFTSFSEGEYAHIHTHAWADISGCYYYNTSGEDGELFFESPVNDAVGSVLFAKYTERINIKPRNGLMVLFPGWLRHGVKTNTTKIERNSLSFNIFLDRTNW